MVMIYWQYSATWQSEVDYESAPACFFRLACERSCIGGAAVLSGSGDGGSPIPTSLFHQSRSAFETPTSKPAYHIMKDLLEANHWELGGPNGLTCAISPAPTPTFASGTRPGGEIFHVHTQTHRPSPEHMKNKDSRSRLRRATW